VIGRLLCFFDRHKWSESYTDVATFYTATARMCLRPGCGLVDITSMKVT
jgi:hypothetical protein